jgi:transposase-like protein
MTQPLSEDLRVRVVAGVERGGRWRAVAEQLGIAASTVTKWVRRLKRAGSLAPTLAPGDIIILYNLPAHKPAAVRAAIVEAIAKITPNDCHGYFTAAG